MGCEKKYRVALKSVSAPVLGDTRCCKKVMGGIEPDKGRYFLSVEFGEALKRLGEDPWTINWPKPK